jgi:hypothetical protein
VRLTRTLPAAILALTLASACSGSSSKSSSSGAPTGKAVTGAGVSVNVPSGWTSQEVVGQGLVVAENKGDLGINAPSGPRFAANPSSGEPADAGTLLATAQSESPSVRGTPESVTVDGKPGVAVESTVVRTGLTFVDREVIVEIGQGSAYTFTLETPESQWDANEGTLEQILDSVRFASG